MQARDICLLASREAKGGAGMVALAGQYLNLVLEDLKLNRDLKVNRVTQILTVGSGTNGPFPLEADYLRTYDLFYSLQGPNGETQFLTPITMEQYDAEFKGPGQAANYPYEFATDLSTQVQSPSVTAGEMASITITDAGIGFFSPPTITFIAAGGGSGAAASATLGVIASIIPWNLGAGYTLGDILTLVGGTYTRPAKLRVIDNGSMTMEVVDSGDYTVLPGNPATYPTGVHITGDAGTLPVTGGSGAGLLVRVVWGVTRVTVTAAGSGYDPALTFITVTGGNPLPTNAVMTPTISAAVGGTAGDLYIYPQSNAALQLTHRYMRNQPDIVSPESSSEIPWFAYTDYLVKHTAGRLMGITGDDRQDSYLAAAAEMLRPHLIMEGDEQGALKTVRLDPRTFKTARGLRPTKQNPY